MSERSYHLNKTGPKKALEVNLPNRAMSVPILKTRKRTQSIDIIERGRGRSRGRGRGRGRGKERFHAPPARQLIDAGDTTIRNLVISHSALNARGYMYDDVQLVISFDQRCPGTQQTASSGDTALVNRIKYKVNDSNVQQLLYFTHHM